MQIMHTIMSDQLTPHPQTGSSSLLGAQYPGICARLPVPQHPAELVQSIRPDSGEPQQHMANFTSIQWWLTDGSIKAENKVADMVVR